jgi:uncharacterized delta-60 repeat protein
MSTIRVDKIMPFQSSSVEIVGSFNGTYSGSFSGSFVGDGSGLTGISGVTPINTGSFATTGSNTFVGDQDIQGTLTASIQEGYVLVGGVGDVSTLAATSSFGGGGSTDISSLNTFTESADGRLDNLELSAGSFATTGSNTFRGIETISGSILVSGSVNADGFELDGSTTTTIPTLNDSFNLELVGSGSTSTFINKSLVLGDGKILVAGRFQSIDGHTTNDIARLNSDGTIDTSFVAPMFSGSNFVGGDTAGWVNTFATQSDGKIVVGGNFIRVGEGVDARRGIARLNTDGTLDTSFVTQSFDSFASSNGVRDLVIQDDGKIIFVGTFTSGSRRVNIDGTLDTSFDISQGNSQALSFNNGNFYSVALLDSGSEQAVLIGGDFVQWGGYNYPYLVKLNPNGTLDFGFAGSNLDLITGGDYTDRIKKIKVGDDGNIYIAGKFRDTGIGNHAGFAVVLPTDDRGDGRGALDNGFRTYISGSFVNDFDFYDGDKILLGGSFTTFGNPSFFTTSANRFAIVDQNDGGLVNNWLTDTLSAKYNLNTGSVNSVTLLSGDNVLVGGTFTQANSTAREGLASLKLTGFGDVTTTSEYTITADSTRLLVSSSTTQFSGDVNIVGNVTASIQEGYVLVGGAGDVSKLTATSSFGGGGGDAFPYTGDAVISGSFATTGSNTFVGDQDIQGTLTASIQEGYVLVGGAGDVSKLTATSSFGGGGGDAFPYTGDAVISGSLTITGSLNFSQPSTNITASITEYSGGISLNAESTVDGAYAQLYWNGLPGTGNPVEGSNKYSVAYVSDDGFTVQYKNTTNFQNSIWRFRTDGVLSVPGNITGAGNLATTGSNSFRGNQSISGSLTVSGSVAQEVTGSVNITGSLNVSGSVNVDGSGFIILSQVSSSYDFVDDSAAASGGVPLGGLYHTSGTIKIRLV